VARKYNDLVKVSPASNPYDVFNEREVLRGGFVD
jgi:hypothetical protein